MNCFPNCFARSGVLKQSREPIDAFAYVGVIFVPTNTNPAASLSYVNQGNHLSCSQSEKSGTKPSSLFHASAMVNSLFRAISALICLRLMSVTSLTTSSKMATFSESFLFTT